MRISSPGSVVATVEMLFGISSCEPLRPLQDKIAEAKLGQYTVDRQLQVFQPTLSPTTENAASTGIYGLSTSKCNELSECISQTSRFSLFTLPRVKLAISPTLKTCYCAWQYLSHSI